MTDGGSGRPVRAIAMISAFIWQMVIATRKNLALWPERIAFVSWISNNIKSEISHDSSNEFN